MIDSSATHSILVRNFRDVTIEANDIKDHSNAEAVRIGNNAGTVVNRNRIRALGGTAIVGITGEGMVTIANNRIYGDDEGIDLSGFSSTTSEGFILHNSILTASGVAINLYADGFKDVEVHNNIFATEGTGPVAQYDGKLNVIDYNAYHSEGNDIIRSVILHADFTELANQNPGFEEHGMITDPELTSTSLLAANSQLDGTAKVLTYTIVASDYKNEPRSTTMPDIGADEFSSTSIAEARVVKQMGVFPNPVQAGTSAITIDLEDTDLRSNAILQCTDITGRRIFSIRLNGAASRRANITLPASMGAGVYLLKLQSGQDVYMSRLVVAE